MNEIVREFLIETHENLAQLDLDLVTLEKEPGERETLARVFRTLHTVKGTAGFLGLAKLQAVAHAGEDLLGRLRAGELTFNPEIGTALLAVVDAVRQVLAAVEATGAEGDGDYTALVRLLERLAHPSRTGSGSRPGLSVAAPRLPAPEPAPVVIGPTRVSLPDPPPAPPPIPTPAPPPVSMVDRGPTEARAAAVTDSSIRVDVGLLDKLMTLVGELVLTRNQLVQFGAAHEDAGVLNTVQRLNLLTTELQAGVMKTRMQPIGSLWGKFPRLVRDIAVACGKQVRIDLEGQETELDKTVLEAVRDPLTHLVRNAVDHGIEAPAARAARGKPAEGRLHLHAAHVGGKVVVELADDGGGIDPARVRDKAVAAGLVTPEQAARMSDRDAIDLVFLPGFSTADRVSHFSGRGVGMDVVRTNVEKIGGTVDIDSRLGGGTTVRMKIPLTLAIIPALTVSAGGDRYAIPQVSLIELLRLDGRQAAAVESVHGAPVYRLRGNLLPLVYLDRELQVGPGGRPGGDVCVVVLQADDRLFGLVVDDIHDTQEIVVKPLQKLLKGIGVLAGATIMGDGRVALILDVLGLAQRAGVVSGTRDRAASTDAAAGTETPEARESVLLVSARGGRMAIPLAAVDRLEEFPRAAVERVGGRAVVQYRGDILPLVPIARAAGRRRTRRARRGCSVGPVRVVVATRGGRRVGLVVGRIVDIVEQAVAGRSAGGRAGVLFTAVVQDRVTEFLDLDAVLGPAGAAP